jgi:hypothetical protein
MGRAIINFLQDLAKGDPVALGLLAFFLFLLAIPAVIWVIDRSRRKNDPKQSKKRRDSRASKP